MPLKLSNSSDGRIYYILLLGLCTESIKSKCTIILLEYFTCYIRGDEVDLIAYIVVYFNL